MTAGESRVGTAAFNSLPPLCLCDYAGKVDTQETGALGAAQK